MVNGAVVVELDKVCDVDRLKAAVAVAALLAKLWLARKAAKEVLVAAGVELTLLTPLPPPSPHPVSKVMAAVSDASEVAPRNFIIYLPLKPCCCPLAPDLGIKRRS
jgi:hypothetical protein